MDKIIVLPTWLIVRASQLFLRKNHPLKKRGITLANWAKYSTDINKQYSIVFWIFIFCGIAVSIMFYLK